jgi:two-component system, chemotaxis family, CheB/CheR fusion protein
MNGAAAELPPVASGGLDRAVGIGSSAGGIAALQALLRGLPGGLPFAYVVAQHMSPDQDSHLVELLARETGLRVVFALDGMELTPGSVVVAQAGCDIRVVGDRVQVVSPGGSPGPSPSIDSLFNSLADSWGPRAVAVVLSGSGDDGVQGAEAVRAGGGLVIAETPDSAGFGAMPQAAIDSGAVELVLDPAEMGPELGRMAAAVPGSAEVGSAESDDTEAIIASLRWVTGIDFSGYKRPTIQRQIARRRALTQVGEVSAYRDEVARDPGEAQALARALLVTVTSFFRDPDSWTALGGLLGRVCAERDPAVRLRVWVPGCATGEEAYTAGMIAAEALGNPEDLAARLKVFATDLNEASLEVARRGVYTQESVSAIPEPYRQRWLTEGEAGTLEVVTSLRACVVYARHNVAFDPPFPNINLICLRNTMIYLQPHLRDGVLRLCHFALAPDGLLLLGDSERLDIAEQHFVAQDRAHHIYRRRAGVGMETLPTAVTRPTPVVRAPATLGGFHEQAALQDELIRQFSPPGLVVDANDQVVRMIGDVTPWCEFPDGAYSNHVTGLLRKPIRPVVSALLLQVRRGGRDTAEADAHCDGTWVHCTVARLGGSQDGLAVLSFRPVADPAAPRGTDTAAADTTGSPATDIPADLLVAQLTATQRALEVSLADLSAANEEQQVLNEELQASAEELQASSEELQAANEELAASNEELSTMNAELQIRGDLLVQANTDLQNIQSSLTSGMILVDRELRVIRYTPLAVRLFSLIEADIGRPLTAIPTSLPVAGLSGQLQAAVNDSVSGIVEVQGPEADFLLACQPFTAAEGEVIGAVVVVTDVTELSAARRAIACTRADLEVVTNALVEAVWLTDADGRLRVLNRRVTDMFGLDYDQVLADPGLLSTAVHPDDRAHVAAAAKSRSPSRDITYRVVRPDGSLRWIQEHCQLVAGPAGDGDLVVSSALDVTDRRVLADAAHDRDLVLQAVFDNCLVGVLILGGDGSILAANDCLDTMLRYPPHSLVGTPLSLLLAGSPTPDEGGGEFAGIGVGTSQRMMTAADGSSRFVSVSVSPVTGDQPQEAAAVAVIHDATTTQTLRNSLAAQVRYDPQTGAMTRSYFRERVVDELAHAQRRGAAVAVLWVDLDDFKAINDQYGHAVGDIVLRDSAGRLRSVTRTGDHIGRVGGDEFVILVKDIDVINHLELAIDRILAAVSEPIQVQDWLIYVSASVGVALFPEDGVDADQLLRNADTAMYTAKRGGGNQRAYFRSEMNEAAADRASMRQQLAVAVRHGDFQMFYQPILATTDLQVTAVEALLRWHRDTEFVAAGQFVAAAGETGQMRAIGRLVLAMVDADMKELARAGLTHLPISINFSPEELEDRPLVDALLAWQPTGGFGRVLIEVTESSQLTTGGRATETLRLIQRLGAHLVIDDFGTGYSNLQTLEHIHPSVVKIDRTMLAGADQSKRRGRVLAAAVQMAQALDARVVIEGVETADQHRLATSLGAEEMQGNLFAEAMPLTQLLDWLDDQGPRPAHRPTHST